MKKKGEVGKVDLVEPGILHSPHGDRRVEKKRGGCNKFDSKGEEGVPDDFNQNYKE